MSVICRQTGPEEQRAVATPAETPEVSQRRYHCGTLSYSKAGLVMLFVWLLWGDFCFTIMESVVPTLLPLKLKSLEAPNWILGLIMTTLPATLNMTVCPYVSFKSDRYRSRWGRRIPFIVLTMPFLCGSLILLGFSEPLAAALHARIPALGVFSAASICITLLAVFMTMFQFFNMFVNSVFWYLFNDVVPAAFLARFTGSFRVVGTLAGASYNYFVFKYAGTHMSQILIGTALLYFFGFLLMCVMVREGHYPLVDHQQGGAPRRFKALEDFFHEAFSTKFYLLFFLFGAFQAVANAIGTFNIFFQQEMGLTYDDIGDFNALMGLLAAAAIYFSAILIDRWHPLRVCAYLSLFIVIGSLMNWVWVAVTLPSKTFFWLMAGNGIILTFQSAMLTACSLPLCMRIFPKSRYGQFCSAGALVRSLLMLVSGVAAGVFIDLCKRFCGGGDFGFRLIFIWVAAFNTLAAASLLWVYIKWRRLGGDAGYRPPAPWSPEGVEEMEPVPFAGASAKLLDLALKLFRAIMVVSLLAILPLMWWMHRAGQDMALRWHTLAVLPLSVVSLFVWMVAERMISRGTRTHSDHPQLHHGVLLVTGATYLLAVGLWIAQELVALRLHMQREAIMFGLANGLTNLMLTGGVVLLWWLEARVEPAGRGKTVALSAA